MADRSDDIERVFEAAEGMAIAGNQRAEDVEHRIEHERREGGGSDQHGHQRRPRQEDADHHSLAAAEQGLSGALGRLFALSEAYPDLKANENMMQLSEELTTTENKVAFARQAYNDSVMDYNTLRESFPNNFFAGWFNFRAAELLEIEDEAKREVPKVSF